MAITINDICNKEFTVRGGGYDSQEVDDYLNAIMDEMEAMQQQIADLQSQLSAPHDSTAADNGAYVEELQRTVNELRAKLQAASKGETARASETLETILLNAQKLADDAVEQARANAKKIVEDAKVQAAQIIGNANGEKDMLSHEIESLKKNAADYRKAFGDLLKKYTTQLSDDAFFGGK